MIQLPPVSLPHEIQDAEKTWNSLNKQMNSKGKHHLCLPLVFYYFTFEHRGLQTLGKHFAHCTLSAHGMVQMQVHKELMTTKAGPDTGPQVLPAAQPSSAHSYISDSCWRAGVKEDPRTTQVEFATCIKFGWGNLLSLRWEFCNKCTKKALATFLFCPFETFSAEDFNIDRCGALLFVSPSHSEATKNWFKFWKSNKIDTSYLRSKWSSLQIPGVGQSLRLSARAAMPRQATQGLPLNVSSSKLLHTWAIHLGCWHSKGTRRWILVSSSPSLQGCDPRSACCHI